MSIYWNYSLKTSERYGLIDSIIREYRLSGLVTHFCEVTDVSRSGYCYWKNSEATRYKKYERDRNYFELFHQVYLEKYGIDGIKIALKDEYDIAIIHNKIRRILRMYGIISLIRVARLYRKNDESDTRMSN